MQGLSTRKRRSDQRLKEKVGWPMWIALCLSTHCHSTPSITLPQAQDKHTSSGSALSLGIKTNTPESPRSLNNCTFTQTVNFHIPCHRTMTYGSLVQTLLCWFLGLTVLSDKRPSLHKGNSDKLFHPSFTKNSQMGEWLFCPYHRGIMTGRLFELVVLRYFDFKRICPFPRPL